jgi:hypothetical protein
MPRRAPVSFDVGHHHLGGKSNVQDAIPVSVDSAIRSGVSHDGLSPSTFCRSPGAPGSSH